MVNSSTQSPSTNKFVIKTQSTTPTPTSIEQKENKFSSGPKLGDLTNKPKESPLLRKGFKVTNKITFSHCNSDSEAKKKPTSNNGLSFPYSWLYFAPNFNFEKFKKHLIMVYKGLIYATKSLKSPSDKFIASKQVIVPDPPTSNSQIQRVLIIECRKAKDVNT